MIMLSTLAKPKMWRAPIPVSPEVRFAPGLWEKMLHSVGALEPEHYAVLGGRLDDPFYVTDLFPMPPMLDERGSYRSSSSTVTLNAPFIEYLLNTSLVPFGKYILGLAHSHPEGFNQLSGGLAGSGYGDIPSMRAHLEAARRYGQPWHNFIAPIITYPGPDPQVDTYIVRLDTPYPIKAETVWETDKAPAPKARDQASDAEEFLKCALEAPYEVGRMLMTLPPRPSSKRTRSRTMRRGKTLIRRQLRRRERKGSK